MKKISFIMPTYNDADTICDSLESIRKQSFDNWELVIVDDGSSDNTRDVITKYINDSSLGDKISYHFQENADQLHAVQNALEYVSGDYIYILHSDDHMYNQESLADFIAYQEKFPGFDAYYGDYVEIDARGVQKGRFAVREYKQSLKEAALMYLWLGRNLYIDMAYFRADIFRTVVNKNYLTDNIPYWLDFESDKCCINARKFDFPMFRYRVFEGNYINVENGKNNVLNGELRTVMRLMKRFCIPCYKFQYIMYRVFNKLKLGNLFLPLYIKREEKNKASIIDFVIKKRFPQGYSDNPYYSAIYGFFKNVSERILALDDMPENLRIYRGNDMRAFNKAILNVNLDEFYCFFMDEMKKGFAKIKCSGKDTESLTHICEFFGILEYIEFI